MEKTLPKSVRKYIRKEKARIRREVLSLDEQQELINKLYQKFLGKQEIVNKKTPNSKIQKSLRAGNSQKSEVK